MEGNVNFCNVNDGKDSHVYDIGCVGVEVCEAKFINDSFWFIVKPKQRMILTLKV